MPFLAGVFASRARADAELAAIPSEIRGRYAIGSRADLAFPCLILEIDGDLELVTEAEALAVIAAVRPPCATGDQKPVLVNLYRLTEEFAPRRPGYDYMGSILHWHLGALDLDRVRRHGLSILWTGALRG